MGHPAHPLWRQRSGNDPGVFHTGERGARDQALLAEDQRNHRVDFGGFLADARTLFGGGVFEIGAGRPTGAGPEFGTTDRVIERAIGSFSGWPSVNDFVQGTGWSIMHCCTGNAARTLYYVWERIITHDNGRLKVNLLLNRASRWADILSYLPYQGRVDVRIKHDINLEIRLPEWVMPEHAVCTVDGAQRTLTFAGRYAVVGAVKASSTVVFTFPIS